MGDGNQILAEAGTALESQAGGKPVRMSLHEKAPKSRLSREFRLDH
jgi:hypothetical protein